MHLNLESRASQICNRKSHLQSCMTEFCNILRTSTAVSSKHHETLSYSSARDTSGYRSGASTKSYDRMSGVAIGTACRVILACIFWLPFPYYRTFPAERYVLYSEPKEWNGGLSSSPLPLSLPLGEIQSHPTALSPSPILASGFHRFISVAHAAMASN